MILNKIVLGDNPTLLSYKVKINKDTFVTFGYAQKNLEVFSEVYTGRNYMVGSDKNSYSRVYKSLNIRELLKTIPSKYVKYVEAMYHYLHTGLGDVVK